MKELESLKHENHYFIHWMFDCPVLDCSIIYKILWLVALHRDALIMEKRLSLKIIISGTNVIMVPFLYPYLLLYYRYTLYNIPIIIVAYCAENWFVVNTSQCLGMLQYNGHTQDMKTGYNWSWLPGADSIHYWQVLRQEMVSPLLPQHGVIKHSKKHELGVIIDVCSRLLK